MPKWNFRNWTAEILIRFRIRFTSGEMKDERSVSMDANRDRINSKKTKVRKDICNRSEFKSVQEVQNIT